MLDANELATERSLVEASQKDPRRFDQLYERYFNRVYAFALTRTGNRTMAEDVTAETFRKAFQNLSQFEWRGVPFSAWLFRIASNAATDLHATTSREEVLVDLPVDAGASWESRLIEVEERVELFDLVERLPRQQREVIVLRFSEERSIREVATAIGRSEGAVKQLQFRACQTLRRWMSESHE